MQHINLKVDGDTAWPELADKKAISLPSEYLEVAFLDEGTADGRPVVIVRADDDGVAYIIQLTGRSFQAIAAALHGKYGVIE